MTSLTLPQLLSLSGVAALFGVVGTLAATWMKDDYLARRSERRASDRALRATYSRYRDPILLAATEAEARLDEICATYPPAYLRTEVLTAVPATVLRANSASDPYYQQYRLVSTVYRICALLGWLERYRREVTFLDTGSRRTTRELSDVIDRLRGDFADGHLNTADDWKEWTDRLVFREEQRAIGASMLVEDGDGGTLGYSEFRALFRVAAQGTEELWWIATITGFLIDLAPTRDFRRKRLERAQQHLEELIALLDPPAGGRRSADRWRRPRRRATA